VPAHKTLLAARTLFIIAVACSNSTFAQNETPGGEAWIAVTDERGVQTVNLECGQGWIDPPEIVVKNNAPVELLVRTKVPGQVFDSGFMPPAPIGDLPSPHRFTPPRTGVFVLSCRAQEGDEQNRGEATGAGRGKARLFVVLPGRNAP
jgi:hypothetical protein